MELFCLSGLMELDPLKVSSFILFPLFVVVKLTIVCFAFLNKVVVVIVFGILLICM